MRCSLLAKDRGRPQLLLHEVARRVTLHKRCGRAVIVRRIFVERIVVVFLLGEDIEITVQVLLTLDNFLDV